MSGRTRRRSSSVALAVLGAQLGALALAGPARAEMFVFRDERREPTPGEVLVEFADVLFVALDGQPSGSFVRRAELAAIVDDVGQRHEAPPLGAFARVGGPTPAAALTDAVGEVSVGGAPVGATGEAVFVAADAVVTTGESGLARLVFPSGAVVKLGPAAELIVLAGGVGEGVVHHAGEAFVETRLRPLLLELAGGHMFTVDGGAQASCLAGAPGGPSDALAVQVHRASAALRWPEGRVELVAGQGATLRRGTDGWRLTADLANTEALALLTHGEASGLAPGEEVAAGREQQGAAGAITWELLRSEGALWVRRGAQPWVELAPEQRARLGLRHGDGLRTGARGGATLSRVDGASVTLDSSSELSLDPERGLTLVAGGLRVEAANAAVRVATPGGPAELRLSVLRLQRPVGQEAGPPAPAEAAPAAAAPAEDALELTAQAGAPAVPLGPAARLTLETGAAGRVSATGERLRAELARGVARAVSIAPTAAQDPGFAVRLAPGDALGVAPLEGGLVALELPGERVLGFLTPGVGATVALAEGRVALAGGAALELKPGLRLGLAREPGGAPELRFVSGPRLRLEEPLAMLVENPTVVVRLADGGETTLALEGDVQGALIAPGGQHAAAAVRTRVGDAFEVAVGGQARLDRHAGRMRFAYGDRRQILVEEGAPPVEARFADPTGLLFLTMPGAPAMPLPAGRPVTVLVTAQGELMFADPRGLGDGAAGLDELLSGQDTPGAVELIAEDRLSDLLDTLPPDSPSGP